MFGSILAATHSLDWSSRTSIRATVRGKTIGAKVGDGWTLPTWVVLDGAEVTWRWTGTHAGDRPDFREVPRSTAA